VARNRKQRPNAAAKPPACYTHPIPRKGRGGAREESGIQKRTSKEGLAERKMEYVSGMERDGRGGQDK